MAREPDVALLIIVFGLLDIFLTRLLWMKLFLQFSIHQTTKPSATPSMQHPEVALTVRSVLFKTKFRHLPLFKIVDFALKCTH